GLHALDGFRIGSRTRRRRGHRSGRSRCATEQEDPREKTTECGEHGISLAWRCGERVASPGATLPVPGRGGCNNLVTALVRRMAVKLRRVGISCRERPPWRSVSKAERHGQSVPLSALTAVSFRAAHAAQRSKRSALPRPLVPPGWARAPPLTPLRCVRGSGACMRGPPFRTKRNATEGVPYRPIPFLGDRQSW